MSDTDTQQKSNTHQRDEGRAPAGSLQSRPSGSGSPDALSSERGRTTVADGVVAKIAGIATREVRGVHEMGSGTSRTFGAMRQRIPGAKRNVAQGVDVEVGRKQCAVDLDIVVEYGVEIAALAAEVRETVIEALERMTGLEVVEVNIAVDDVHIAEDGSSQEPRVH
ncbi:Asp23/Gls24 family envelope stress response protein [Uniformispora flossi]|uniref:Asp23/Gls24 family envelope stress response protein n=1 Tax=Uniformispora flossi TaxID=3390723 RepID=UPI003C2FF15C